MINDAHAVISPDGYYDSTDNSQLLSLLKSCILSGLKYNINHSSSTVGLNGNSTAF